MRGARWDDGWNKSAFTSVGSHAAPSDAVVVAGGSVVPVGVETVVGGTVACGLVLGDGLCARGKRLHIGRAPVQIVLHGLVWLLVQRGRNVKVRSLEDGIIPGCWSPYFFEASFLKVGCFVPSG